MFPNVNAIICSTGSCLLAIEGHEKNKMVMVVVENIDIHHFPLQCFLVKNDPLLNGLDIYFKFIFIGIFLIISKGFPLFNTVFMIFPDILCLTLFHTGVADSFPTRFFPYHIFDNYTIQAELHGPQTNGLFGFGSHGHLKPSRGIVFAKFQFSFLCDNF